ncbi:MAG: VOC family protein, partial [Thermoplasmata archaeon]|nr:VOC family protein [Thermoplasmata archaeon]
GKTAAFSIPNETGNGGSSPWRVGSVTMTIGAGGEFETQSTTDEEGIVHAAVRVEGCTIEVGRASSEWKPLTAGIHLYVRDVDEVYARALAAGGRSLHEVREMDYGERSGAIEDPGGNQWYLATYTG